MCLKKRRKQNAETTCSRCLDSRALPRLCRLHGTRGVPMKRVKEFCVYFHGVEHEQYFQGHGVAFTRYTECATGIGNTPNEALEDCLEQLACAHDWDVEDLEDKIRALHGAHLAKGEESKEELPDDCHHFVSISVLP